MKIAVDEHQYDDIIALPHHISFLRPQMSRSDRAAQFAPFKAMVGLEEQIDETARLTDKREILSEEQQQEIDRTLHQLKEYGNKQPKVKLIYFQPDGKKDGGAYITKEGFLKKIDEMKKTLVFTDGSFVVIENIFRILDYSLLT